MALVFAFHLRLSLAAPLLAGSATVYSVQESLVLEGSSIREIWCATLRLRLGSYEILPSNGSLVEYESRSFI
jgi:hypothetical protein